MATRYCCLLAILTAMLVLGTVLRSIPDTSVVVPVSAEPLPKAPPVTAVADEPAVGVLSPPTRTRATAAAVATAAATGTATAAPTAAATAAAADSSLPATPETSTTEWFTTNTTTTTTTNPPSTTTTAAAASPRAASVSITATLAEPPRTTMVHAPPATKKPLPADKLGAHPLESSFVQGHADPDVQALARVMTPLVSHGYYYGFVSLVGGGHFAIRSRQEFDIHQKGRAFADDGAIVYSIHKAVKTFSNGSMVILWVGDTSPFCYADAREIIGKLNAEQGFGRLWWLTYNPCILDAAGRIGEYEVPVPSFDLHAWNDVGMETRNIAMHRRNRQVVWRGQTTGVGDDGDYRYNRWGNYRTCHRYKVVESFNTFADAHPDAPFDVKFTGDEINSQGMVPKRFWGKRASSSVSAQIQLDVDGNGISWLGVRRKLGSGSVVLRAYSNMTQFYFPRLKNGTHILVFNTTDELAEAAYRLVRSRSEDTLRWMASIARNGAEVVDQITSRKLKGYEYDRLMNAVKEYDADKDWRIQL